MKNKKSNTTTEVGHWLDRERLILYSCVFLALFILLGVVWVLMSIDPGNQQGYGFGNDFIPVWVASHLALTGHAQDVYDTTLLFKAQKLVAPALTGYYIWFYPPALNLVILPLALLPFIAAYWTYMLSTLGAYLLVLRQIVRDNTAIWCIAAFSGLWLNLFDGQNAFLTAAIGGASLLFVERRPVVAGIFLGLLAIKPHLALLFPVALVAIGAWRTIITAVVTAVTFTLIATLTLGMAVLKGFFSNLGHVRLVLENQSIVWRKMPSVFAFMRLVGIPVTWAYVAHVAVAVVAMIIVWQVWRHCQNQQLRGAALVTATFLVSPYVFLYDLAWLALSIAWLALDGIRHGWLRGDREVLVVAWLLPMLMVVQTMTFLIVPVGPLVLCSLLWITVRRVRAGSMGGLATDVSDSCCGDGAC